MNVVSLKVEEVDCSRDFCLGTLRPRDWLGAALFFEAAIGCPVGGTELISYTFALLSDMADSTTRQSIWRSVEGRADGRIE